MLALKMKARLWIHPGPGSWHFITLPPKQAREIKASQRGRRKGWGSVPVIATIGKTTWKTSVFPDGASSYVLPVKAEVRKREDLREGMTFVVRLELTFPEP